MDAEVDQKDMSPNEINVLRKFKIKEEKENKDMMTKHLGGEAIKQKLITNANGLRKVDHERVKTIEKAMAPPPVVVVKEPTKVPINKGLVDRLMKNILKRSDVRKPTPGKKTVIAEHFGRGELI